jgi:hypothetical protein
MFLWGRQRPGKSGKRCADGQVSGLLRGWKISELVLCRHAVALPQHTGQNCREQRQDRNKSPDPGARSDRTEPEPMGSSLTIPYHPQSHLQGEDPQREDTGKELGKLDVSLPKGLWVWFFILKVQGSRAK